jgi:methylsterol monooxygenase
MSTWQVPLPDWRIAAVQIAIFFVYEDMFHYFGMFRLTLCNECVGSHDEFYVAHQFLHWGPMYKHVHKIHHKYSAPFGLAAEYCHPAEVFILGAGTLSGPILYTFIAGNFHVFTMYIWITLRLFQAIDAHSGYDFPWSLQHILPFWAGAEHHDFHHMAFVNNYSTSFRWLDRLFGTDTKYLKHVKNVKAAKKLAKNHDEYLILERKLMADTEAEGQRAEADVIARRKLKAA